MELVFLGTGNAFASGGRNAMAILLRIGPRGVLLDCGPTTLVALKKAGLAPADVDFVLLSHLHGDHYAGVPFLLCHERYEGKRAKPLTVFGPRGAATAVETAASLFFPGIAPYPFRFETKDLDPGEERREDEIRFRPFQVDHFSRGVAFGYRLEVEGKTLVFSGDTAWTEALSRETQRADLLICECSSFEIPLELHMSHRDLLANRDRIGARRILLVHPGDDVIAREEELAFELARDGMRLTL
jgi:ribonuclease BN (tRNA processing enzyme)